MDRLSSAVQAVAIFFPVTDLLNLGDSTENRHDGGPPKSFTRAFAQEPVDLPSWKVTGRAMSPLYHLTSNLPPVLIVHGDVDTLVPLDQSVRFRDRAQEVGARVELQVHPGFGHGAVPTAGWPKALALVPALKGLGLMILDIRRFAEWFERQLVPAGKVGWTHPESRWDRVAADRSSQKGGRPFWGEADRFSVANGIDPISMPRVGHTP